MTAAATEVPEQVLEFTLGAERYCVGIDRIDEIVKPNEITELPDTPPQVEGVMDLRGEMTTIMNPRLVFDIHEDGESRQIVIFNRDHDHRLGWLVDHVHKVSNLADADVDPVTDNRYVNGVLSDGDRFVIWVDPDGVNGAVST
ncbi:MAG: chemotaxis protein CheW [Halobacteriales archaeon]